MSELETFLTAIDRQLAQARIARDLTTYDRLTDETYIGIDAGGVVTTKAERIADFFNLVYDTFKTDDYQIRFYDDVAIVIAHMVASGNYKGSPFSGTYRYTHTYRLRDGEWRIISAHTCRIA